MAIDYVFGVLKTSHVYVLPQLLNTLFTFPKVRYYPNENYDHHSNLILVGIESKHLNKIYRLKG